MEHQDFKTIILNPKHKKKIEIGKKDTEKKLSQKQVKTTEEEIIKIEADKKLGQILSQARISKGFNKQSDFVKELSNKVNLNVSLQIYSKWESNKEVPTNEQISKMEKFLCIKLPRNKKVKIMD